MATSGGFVVTNDGLVYLETAKNLAAGRGYSFGLPPEPLTPLVHFPPLFPLSIAALLQGMPSALDAARWVIILCFGAEAWLAIWLAQKIGPGSHLGSFLAGGFLILHPHVLQNHSCVVSEPLFLALLLGTTACLVAYGERRTSTLLAVASLLAGLSAITRYSGLVVVAVCPLVVAYCRGGDWRQRLRAGCISAAVCSLPYGIWIARNLLVSHAATNRKIHLHWISQTHLQEGLLTISAWFLPWRLVSIPSGILAVAVVGIALFAWARIAGGREPSSASAISTFACFAIIFSCFYVLHLGLAISLLDYSTPLDDRLLLPVFVFFLLVLAVLPSFAKRPSFRFSASLLGIAFLLLTGLRGWSWFQDPLRIDKSILSQKSITSPPLRFLAQLPPEAEIWTNTPLAIYGAIRRPVRDLPQKRHPHTTATLPWAEASLRKIAATAGQHPTYLAYYQSDASSVNYSPEKNSHLTLGHVHEYVLAELQQHFVLQPVVSAGRMGIFQILPPDAAAPNSTPGVP